MTPVFEFLRQRIWGVTLGVALAGALLIMIGPGAVWVLLALILIAAGIVRFIVPVARARLPEARPGDEGLTILSPLVRKVLGQMPVHVMLQDSGSRVLFVNEPMRTVVGPSTDRMPISTVLRNPEVLNAIAQTSGDGEPARAQFTVAVPIERHYEAYSALVCNDPMITVLVLH